MISCRWNLVLMSSKTQIAKTGDCPRIEFVCGQVALDRGQGTFIVSVYIHVGVIHDGHIFCHVLSFSPHSACTLYFRWFLKQTKKKCSIDRQDIAWHLYQPQSCYGNTVRESVVSWRSIVNGLFFLFSHFLFFFVLFFLYVFMVISD